MNEDFVVCSLPRLLGRSFLFNSIDIGLASESQSCMTSKSHSIRHDERRLMTWGFRCVQTIANAGAMAAVAVE
jgi:hypothetical protein